MTPRYTDLKLNEANVKYLDLTANHFSVLWMWWLGKSYSTESVKKSRTAISKFSFIKKSVQGSDDKIANITEGSDNSRLSSGKCGDTFIVWNHEHKKYI